MVATIKYQFKSRLQFIGVISGILLLITFIVHTTSHYVEGFWVDGVDVTGPSEPPFSIAAIAAGFLATIIPIYEFGFKMNKICIDQMYSLPVKREKLYISKFIVGYSEIVIPVTLSFIYSFIHVICHEHMFTLIYFLWFYLSLLFYALMIYGVLSFFFTRANIKRDGIINMGFISFFFVAVVSFINQIVLDTSTEYAREYFEGGEYILFAPINIITKRFSSLAQLEALQKIGYNYLYKMDFSRTTSLVLFAILGVISIVLFVMLNKVEKAENSMQISQSWFSYKTFIPAYLVLLTALFINSSSFLGTVIYMGIAGFIGYVIYRRTLKIKKFDIIVIIAAILVGIGLGAIIYEINKTECFVIILNMFR